MGKRLFSLQTRQEPKVVPKSTRHMTRLLRVGIRSPKTIKIRSVVPAVSRAWMGHFAITKKFKISRILIIN